MNKVFLGGTCGDSTWRDKLIPNLTINYFNPVVPDWTPEAQLEEKRQKEECNIHLYVLTPKMYGVYSIAEIIDSSTDKSKITILTILKDDGVVSFSQPMWKSLEAVANLANNHGVLLVKFEHLADTLNHLTITPNLTIGDVVKLIQEGHVVRRNSWSRQLVLFKQVSQTVGEKIIPNMTSLPEAAKLFILDNTKFISYDNQALLYDTDSGLAEPWNPSIEDLVVNDWMLVK